MTSAARSINDRDNPRATPAIVFIEHGTMKHFGFPAAMEGGTVPLFSLMGFAAILEVVGGALLLVGLFTRPVAFLLAGEMAVAYWMAHAPQSVFPVNNGGDAAILYCFVFLYLFAAGPGPWSLDHWLRHKDEPATRTV